MCQTYLLDLHSRRVIGLAVSNRMKRDLAIRALEMAIGLRRPSKGCIHHSDRGSQGGFKRSSQWVRLYLMLRVRPMLQPVFSTRVFFGGGCLERVAFI